jgi:ABC-type uncharacterized transport system auxiliary subunit
MFGCSVTAPITEFRLNSKIPDSKIEAQLCKDKTIKVLKPFGDFSLESMQMNYMQGNNKIFSYSQSMWAESPSNEIGNEIVKVLRESTLFKSVRGYKSRAEVDLVLETGIYEFIQVFDESLSESHANVSLNFTIINPKDNSVISTKNFKTSIKADSLDANGGVEALNKALSKILLESSFWFGEMCR